MALPSEAYVQEGDHHLHLSWNVTGDSPQEVVRNAVLQAREIVGTPEGDLFIGEIMGETVRTGLGRLETEWEARISVRVPMDMFVRAMGDNTPTEGGE